MKQYFLLLICLILAATGFSQVSIPDFKNDTGKSKAPFLKYVKNYDLILAYRGYSNWSHETEYHLLVLHGSHWEKLTYKAPNYNDPKELQLSPITEKPTTDSLCYSLFNELVANNLFTMKDDSKIPPCNESKMIVKGSEETVTRAINDGPEYSLWMITPAKARNLYYYAPQFFAPNCLPSEQNRAFALKVIGLFNKEW